MCFTNGFKLKGIYYQASILALIPVLVSCTEFLTVPSPSTQLVQEKVFEEDATAIAAMAGVYNKMSMGYSFADGDVQSVTIYEGLYADELTSYTSTNNPAAYVGFYFNEVLPENGNVSSTWGNAYSIIYECNRILEGLDASQSVTTSVKNQLDGEALFIRAFAHFYLTNLFGDVPLILNSDYRLNASISRSPSSLVYESIITDLVEARSLLLNSYPGAGRTRVNKGAAIALLARVYLYQQDYINAEVQSTEIINNVSQYKLSADLNTVFLSNSEEAIWQILPRGGSQNYTNEAALFILVAAPTRFVLRDELYNAFEAGDLRQQQWTNSLSSSSGLTTWRYPYKYKEREAAATGTEYSMVLRLAEQYLIRAEARAQQNKLTGENGAEADINAVRHRAGLPNTIATNQEQLLAAIIQERRVELFTEWGHRFFDLKRTNRLDEVLLPVKPNWRSHCALLPLPKSELLINQNLKQNTGY